MYKQNNAFKIIGRFVADFEGEGEAIQVTANPIYGGVARFKKEYEGLTKIAPPFNLFIYMY